MIIILNKPLIELQILMHFFVNLKNMLDCWSRKLAVVVVVVLMMVVVVVDVGVLMVVGVVVLVVA